MDIGIGAATGVRVYGGNTSLTVDELHTLQQQGIALPYATTLNGGYVRAAGIFKIGSKDAAAMKLMFEDGTTVICGADTLFRDIDGNAVRAQDTVGVPLANGSMKGHGSHCVIPRVRSVIPLSDGVDLFNIDVHGGNNIVLENNTVVYSLV